MTLTEPRLRTLRNIRDKGIPYASSAITRELKRAGLVMQDDDKWWLTEAGHAALAGVESGERLVSEALKESGPCPFCGSKSYTMQNDGDVDRTSCCGTH